MKKTLIALILVLMIAFISVGPAVAQKGKLNIKGEVIAVGGDTLTVQSNKGDTYVITVPDEIDVSAIQVGDSILIKVTAGEGGTWLAISVKQVGRGSDNDDDDDKDKDDKKDEKEKPEGFKDNSAFCAEDKQEKPHPLAPKMAERFGVTEEMVMDYFCEGYSIGAIMLAIKTSQLDGITDSPGDLLTNRADGNGWGQIWKELGLIGSEKNGHSPPGLLKKPDHAGPKDK